MVPTSSTLFSKLSLPLAYSSSPIVNEDPYRLLSRHLENLTKEEQKIYFDLSHHADLTTSSGPEDYAMQKLLSIFQTNAIATTSDKSGIFPQTARLNHACVSSFNCVYTWRDHEAVQGKHPCINPVLLQITTIVTHALKPIKAGEVSSFLTDGLVSLTC